MHECHLLSNSCANLQVKDYAYISTAIIGWYSKVGKWARIENYTIMGEDVSTADELYLNGAVILPHKEMKEHVPDARIIM